MKLPKSFRRQSDGTFSLIELIVATALSVLVMEAVGVIATVSEHTIAISSENFYTQRSANQILDATMSALANAAPLGACQTASGPGFDEPLSSCVEVTSTGSAMFSAASTGPVIGFCFYSYQSGQDVGLVAPDLRCLVAYQDGQMWSFDWQPQGSATYTSCNPSNCWPGAPAIRQLPSEPTSSTSDAVYVGDVSTPSGGQLFAFYDASGSLISDPGSDLQDIYQVSLSADLTWAAPQEIGPAQGITTPVDFSTIVGSDIETLSQSWSYQ